MKFLMLFLFLIVGCGKEVINMNTLPNPEPQSLEGYYALPDGGWADVYEDAQGMYSVRSMRLVVINKDGTSALIPLSSIPANPEVNGVIYYKVNLNYVALSHNLKKDSNNLLLSGSLLTELRISLKDGKLNVEVCVSEPFSLAYSGNVESY
jgi:hypothetical protein